MLLRHARSLLFLPASNPRAIAKARTLPCDMVILDLEDAVADDDAARAASLRRHTQRPPEMHQKWPLSPQYC